MIGKRKRSVEAAFLLVLTMGLIGYLYNGHRTDRKQQGEIITYEPVEEAFLPLDLSEPMQVILAGATQEMLMGYAVDESFLGWIQQEYGKEAITMLSQEIHKGNQNPELWYLATGESLHVLWMEYCMQFGYSSYLWNDVHKIEHQGASPVFLEFVGDINLDDNWYTMLHYVENQRDLDTCIAPEVQQELQNADLAVANNEFTYSLGGKPLKGKAYTFRANPENVKLLEEMGVDLVSLANNHVCDYGVDGLLDTMRILNESKVAYIGAGKDLSDLKTTQYYIMGGRKIAIISATQIERSYTYTKQATVNSPGVLKTQTENYVRNAIAAAKAKSDYVIVYIHWGSEGTLGMASDQKRLMEEYVNAGASLIVGNHPHRMQGVSYYNGVPVVHSLGNFWFSNGSLYTTILKVRINKDGRLDIAMLPCKQENLKVSMLKGRAERDAFYQYVADLSEDVMIGEDGYIYSVSDYRLVTQQITNFRYRSGQHYGNRQGNVDLNNRRIDIVGNY